MEIFELSDDYVELCSLLKVAGPMISGGEAKQAIAGGQVTVDGQIELRKKCKLRAGQVVQYLKYEIKVSLVSDGISDNELSGNYFR